MWHGHQDAHARQRQQLQDAVRAGEPGPVVRHAVRGELLACVERVHAVLRDVLEHGL